MATKKEITEINTDITFKDFNLTFKRYCDLTKKITKKSNTEYYKRKENIWSFIFDHFFLKLFNKFKKLNNNSLVFFWFRKSVLQCHTDYYNSISINKPKHDLSIREFKITNFYNILYYETLVTKLLEYIKLVIQYDNKSKTNELANLLLEWKYFGYAHRINFLSNNYTYQDYRDGWLKFEKEKNTLVKNKKYYIEFDIVNYYHCIDHKLLIDLLKKFFDRYSNFLWIDKFLLTFNEVLFKVNWYNKSWIPQWLLWSDILSTIFLWLFINENKNLLWIENKHWLYNFKDNTNFLYYADDFIFFSDDKYKITKSFNNKFRRLFNQYWLNFHWKNKAMTPLKTVNYTIYDVDFNKIKKKNNIEINNLANKLLYELWKNNIEEINIDALKRYYNWIFSLKYLPNQEYKNILQNIKIILFTDQKIKEDLDRAKIIFILQSISIKNYLFLLQELFQNTKLKIKEVKKIYENYWYLLSNWTIENFYIFLSDNSYFKDLLNELLSINFFKKKAFLLLKNNLLKNEIKRQWLLELENLLYWDFSSDFNENILWLKLFSLFSVDKTKTTQLSWYILKQKKNIDLYKHLTELSYNLIRILDNLILIKNIKPFFYLQDASFLADLYSFFNILLSLWISIKEWKTLDVSISWRWLENIWKIKITDNSNKINTSKINNEVLLINQARLADNIKYLLFYITKSRAEHNHKEINTDWKSSINVFLKYKDNDFFSYSIKEAIDVIFILIEKEISSDL